MTGLSDREVDSLADTLEMWARSARQIQFANYPCGPTSTRKIGIMRASDIPLPGITTMNTFGLAHNSWEKANFPDRIELVQGVPSLTTDYEKILVVVARTILERNELPKPGAIYEHAVIRAELTDLGRLMPHALVIFPYLWQEGYREVRVNEKRVWFLQVVAIFDDEKEFIVKNGLSVFEELVEYHGAKFHDFTRISYVQM